MDCVIPQKGVTACVRFDRQAIYVRSDSANGYFKLGQLTKVVGGDTYRCQNNNTNSAGNGTWVGCNFSWPRACYRIKSGYGQHDWYIINDVNQLKCL
ncbi:hypothetical protein SAMN05421810_106186 [Amycolatopsis arida]|uniref:Uncharacterized protein n=1 Tax=Amycolatopsis arida TaxID=587909 RepID=A0A1I5XPY1_9PSEU|nr:hypothetical protein [Amycolatopsis arida]TDX97332.1 hypothetical protein CLV69_102435 [Amycolatopsis arida]SFQ33797.1 hypothetical protein SAMN05421810_106186 [Amycolatopsis arida]